MARDPRYDILFEPVRIGPKTAKNRFYQVPHCTGMGHAKPQTVAAMRGMKAAGGWAVVCTEYCSIHPTSDDTPFAHCRLWNDDDIRDLALMTDAVHAHGALAGCELWHGGRVTLNRYSRLGLLAPRELTSAFVEPVQARRMDKQDIRNLRRWHRTAARRARDVGFDLVYVYGAHGFGAVQHFLSRRTNQRTDEYGGPLENRARLLRELIEDTKDAVGDRCAVPVRILLDEMMGEAGLGNSEIRDLIGMLAELPDLWDLAHGSWDWCSGTSRFAPEGHMEELVRGIKALTTKPVVGVGRFTSPDAMARQVKLGILDFIGAARPSIADPFLPK
ncbi:MAG: NADH:flavin oxidoreductase, partial [Pseudomonadota bacterium]